MLLKPIVPVVSDLMSHTIAEAVHLSSIHMVYGADHTQQEVAKEATDKKGNHEQNIKADDGSSVHMSYTNNLNFSPTVTSTIDFLNCDDNRSSNVFITRQGPPPKFS